MKHNDQTSLRSTSRLSSLAVTTFSILMMLFLVCSTASAQLAGKGRHEIEPQPCLRASGKNSKPSW